MSCARLDRRARWVGIPAMLAVVFLADRLLGPMFYAFAALGALAAYFGGRRAGGVSASGRVAEGGMLAAFGGAVAMATEMLRAKALMPDIRLLDRSIPVQLANLCIFFALLLLLWRRVYAPQSRVPGAAVIAVCLACYTVVADPFVEKELSSRAKSQCMASLRAYCAAIHTYIDANQGHLPPAELWLESLSATAAPSLPRCPDSPPSAGSYAYNSALGNAPYGSIREPDRVVILFETDAARNAAGGPELLPDTPRHFGGDDYALADGSVKWVLRKRLPDGSWAKKPDADWVRWKP